MRLEDAILAGRRGNMFAPNALVHEGTSADTVLGFAMGAVFGIIMLFWVFEPSIPHRQKLGIMMGISAHVIFATARWMVFPQGQGGGGSRN
mmetsp:Transcript_4535/g.9891  ORF Transcript_4535/g.9891 Transcript_4535/m.9891 type:complete len:91 (+) Transcript_4535:488-760(+)